MASKKTEVAPSRHGDRSGFLRKDMYQVKFSSLRIRPGFNARVDYGDIPLLAAGIKNNLKEMPPLIGRKEGDGFWITDGHRRHAALEYLFKQDGIDREVLFIPEPKGMTDRDRLLTQFVTAQGKELTPLEQADLVRRLKQDHGMNEKEIGQQLGKSGAYINRLSEFHNAPAELIGLVNKGVVSSTAAINMLVKGEVAIFLEEVQSGLYDEAIKKHTQAPADPVPELFENVSGATKTSAGKTAKQAPAAKTAAITEKIIKQKREQKSKDSGTAPAINSWQDLKKFIKGMEGKPKTKEGGLRLLFLTKVLDNKAKMKDIKDFLN